MNNIRRNIFETNSSSTHSVTISSKSKDLDPNKMKINPEDNKIHIQLGRFGWSWDLYNDQSDKLSYILTMVMHNNNLHPPYYSDNYTMRSVLDAIMKTDDFIKINNAVASYAKCDGIYIDESEDAYIDHQSLNYRNISEFLKKYKIDSIERFIFDPYVILETGNDNEDEPDYIMELLFEVS